MSPGERTLPGVLAEAAARWGDRTVLVCERRGQHATFAELRALVEGVSAALRGRGIAAGDRVAVMFRNDLEFPACWLGIAGVGAAMVPLNTHLTAPDLRQQLTAADVALVVADEEFAEVLADAGAAPGQTALVRVGPGAAGLRALGAPAAEPAECTGPWPESTANVQFTSGSTGLSKGCLLSHRYWIAIGEVMRAHGPRLGEADVLLTAQPFSYMDPQWNLVAALLTGARLVVLERFRSDAFWPSVQEHGATFFYCLGVMPAMMLRTAPVPGERTSRVRYIACSAIPLGRHAELEERFGAPWHELYGSTETGIDVLVEAAEHDDALRSGTLGRPLPHREVRIADEHGAAVPRGAVGRLLVRGVAMSDGYLDGPAGSTAGNGWYVTGDLASCDAEGRLYFHGREKDVIRRSGENVSAAQVEAAVQASADVRICACVPVPDEVRGEEIKAYVVPAGDGGLDVPALVAHTRERLAYFKVPRYWELRDVLPMTPSEKVAKGALRAEPTERLAPSYDAVAQCWVGPVHPLPPAGERGA